MRALLTWARAEKNGKLKAIFHAYRWARLTLLPLARELLVRLFPNDADRQAALAHALTEKYSWMITERDHDQEVVAEIGEAAVRHFEAALALDAERFEDYLPASLLLLKLGRHDASVRIIERGIAVQRRLAQQHQLDRLGIRFLPSDLVTSAIGANFFIDAYIKAGILGLRPPSHTVLLLEPSAVPANAHCLKYWSQYISIINDPLTVERLRPVARYLEDSIVVLGTDHGFALSTSGAAAIFRRWDDERRPPLLRLTPQDSERGWQQLARLGVPDGAWFACLHVREAGFKDGGGSQDAFRNSDVETYLPAIQTVVNRGGWVIRVGNPTMKPLPPLEHVIDYARSDIRSDWMDVFLCGQARFFINNSSGPGVVAAAFGVPHIATNYLPTYTILFQERDAFIPKLCWSIAGNRYLTFRELMSPPVSTAVAQHQYDRLGVRIVENTAEELQGFIVEALDRLDGTAVYTEEDERLQAQFRQLTADCGTLAGLPNGALNCRIGRDFLRRHADLLPTDVNSATSHRRVPSTALSA